MAIYYETCPASARAIVKQGPLQCANLRFRVYAPQPLLKKGVNPKHSVFQIQVQPAEVNRAKDGQARHAWLEQMKKDRQICLACDNSGTVTFRASVTSLEDFANFSCC